MTGTSCQLPIGIPLSEPYPPANDSGEHAAQVAIEKRAVMLADWFEHDTRIADPPKWRGSEVRGYGQAYQSPSAELDDAGPESWAWAGCLAREIREHDIAIDHEANHKETSS